MDFQRVLEMSISTVMNLLEESINTMVFAKGKRLFEVWLVTIIILVLVVVLQLLGIPTFVGWKEALSAVIAMGVITLSNSVNKSKVMDLQKKLRKVK